MVGDERGCLVAYLVFEVGGNVGLFMVGRLDSEWIGWSRGECVGV